MVDVSDVNALRAFFEKHKYYTTYELAILVDKAPSTIDKWRSRCGISTGKKRLSDTKKVQAPVTIVPKEIWDNEEWLRNKYEIEKVGLPTIARMIDRSVTLVKRRFDRYKIATRDLRSSMASKNPMCTKQWLLDNYENGGKTLVECAEIANVSPHTISKWLAKFKMSIRDINEAMAGDRNPFWGRRHSEQTKERLRSAYKAGGHTFSRPKRTDSQTASI